MSYIYKITNQVNHKIYIGYTSRTLDRRFYEHGWEAKNQERKTTPLHSAILKYGQENFIIEPVEKFDEKEKSWQELEKFYISYFNCLIPNGYNILPGGNEPPKNYGDRNSKSKISDEQMKDLYAMLKDVNISYDEICNKFKISKSSLYNINSGKQRHNCFIDYPIRKYDIYILNERYK